jgi:hypothetical protein
MKYLYLLCFLIVGCISANSSNSPNASPYPMTYTGTDGEYISGTDSLFGNNPIQNVTITVLRNDSVFLCIEGTHDTIKSEFVDWIFGKYVIVFNTVPQVTSHTLQLQDSAYEKGSYNGYYLFNLSRIIKASR